MQIAILVYMHRHGTDMIPVVFRGGSLPKITNKLLRKLGVFEPELEREDEYVEWRGPFDMKDLPRLGVGPREWSPRD